MLMEKVMNRLAPGAKDGPLITAWEAYKATGDYANAFAWAQSVKYREGSMLEAFERGYSAAVGSLNAERQYWLCCGSTDPLQHDRQCVEAWLGHPERCRFGTRREHERQHPR